MFVILLIVQAVGFEFLSVDPVARRNQGGIAVLGDGYELMYNASALGFAENRISTISYFNYIGGTHFGQLGHQMKTIALGAKYFNGGSLKHTDNMGNELEPATFGVNFIDLSAGKGFRIKEVFALGGCVKFQYQRIDTFTALGAGVDLGATYRIKENAAIGAVVKNLGMGIKPFIEEREMLPLEFGVGGAVNGRNYSLYADVYAPVEGPANFRTGLEYWVLSAVGLKGGFNSFLFETKTGEGAIDLVTGLSAGVAIKVRRFCVDYLVAPYGELAITHRISLSFRHNL